MARKYTKEEVLKLLNRAIEDTFEKSYGYWDDYNRPIVERNKMPKAEDYLNESEKTNSREI